METKYTLGPWGYYKNFTERRINGRICELLIGSTQEIRDHICFIQYAKKHGFLDKETQIANAKLIAAAPDLLEALIHAKELIWNEKYYQAIRNGAKSEWAKSFADKSKINIEIETIINKATK